MKTNKSNMDHVTAGGGSVGGQGEVRMFSNVHCGLDSEGLVHTKAGAFENRGVGVDF